MRGECSTRGRDEKCKHNFSRKPEGKKKLGRLGDRWKRDIRMDLKETVVERADWIVVTQYRDRCLLL